MKKSIVFIVLFVLLIMSGSCIFSQEITTDPTTTQTSIQPTVINTTAPSKILEPTTTALVISLDQVINLTLYDSENVSNIHNNGNGRLTPIEIDGWWNLENREGGIITVKVVEKAGSFNVVEVHNKNRRFLIEISKGAIIGFEIYNPIFLDFFLFSPDVGNNGNPVDCKKGIFCYYPSSSIQIKALDGGNLLVMVPDKEEKDRKWCILPKNDPPYMMYRGERGEYSAYRISSEETTWVWTENNCPEVELVEIIY